MIEEVWCSVLHWGVDLPEPEVSCFLVPTHLSEHSTKAEDDSRQSTLLSTKFKLLFHVQGVLPRLLIKQ